MHFGVAGARRLPARLDARRPLPRRRRRGARVQATARAARRADVLGRRRDEHRRRPRGPQPGGGARRCRPCSCCSRTATPTRRPRAARWSTRAWPTASRAAGGSRPRASTAATRSPRCVAVRTAVEEARAGGGPRAVEAVSLRLDGHAAHDDGSYMDQERLADYVARRDPDRADGRAAAARRALGGRGRAAARRPPPARSAPGSRRPRPRPRPIPRRSSKASTPRS